MYPFYFEITWGYSNNLEFIEKKCAGFLNEESFTSAMKRIEDNFGDELLSVDCLIAVGCENDIITMPIEEGRAARKAYENGI